MRQFIASMWLYFNNYSPPTGITFWQCITGHLWSLCVEEQFYLVWPAICIFAFRLRRPEVIAWILLIAVCVRCQYVHSVPELMYRIDTRGFAIILGCTVALTVRGSLSHAVSWLSGRRFLCLVLLVTGLTIVVCSIGYSCLPQFFDMYSKYLVPLLAIQFALITAMQWYGPATTFTRVLSFKPLAYVGKISYGIYLYHPVAQYLTWKVLLADIEYWPKLPKYGLRLTIFLSLSILFALISYHLYEKFFLRLKDRLR